MKTFGYTMSLHGVMIAATKAGALYVCQSSIQSGASTTTWDILLRTAYAAEDAHAFVSIRTGRHKECVPAGTYFEVFLRV